MNELPKIDAYYQRQGKDLVDMMYDRNLLNPEFSRDNLQSIEDYIAYLFEAGAKSASKTAVLLESLKTKKIK